jgi:hypothetical protein
VHLPSCVDFFSFLTSGRLLTGCYRCVPAVPWTKQGKQERGLAQSVHSWSLAASGTRINEPCLKIM